MRRLAFGLATSLIASTALAGGLGEMTAEERAAFRAEVKAYLMENPEIIVEAMTELQRREDVAAVARDATLLQTHAAALFTAPGDWVGGNPDGDVTVVEFMDYRCGYCQKAHSEVAELVRADGNIRLILKELPVLGEASVIAARFAIATRLIHGEAAYKTTHDALMTLRGDPTAETLTRLATQLGHPPAPILDKMAAPEVTAVIEANHALAMAMQINGTPAFVIDSTMLRGYLPLADLQKIVAEERAG